MEQQNNQKTAKERIKALFKLNELEYNTMVFEIGYDYPANVLSQRMKVSPKLKNTSAYWKWWNTQWELFNEKYLNFCLNTFGPVTLSHYIGFQLSKPFENIILKAAYNEIQENSKNLLPA